MGRHKPTSQTDITCLFTLLPLVSCHLTLFDCRHRQVQIHPFFMLLLAAIVMGLITGMGAEINYPLINSGFGDILGKIGFDHSFWCYHRKQILEKSGGAMVTSHPHIELNWRKIGTH